MIDIICLFVIHKCWSWFSIFSLVSVVCFTDLQPILCHVFNFILKNCLSKLLTVLFIQSEFVYCQKYILQLTLRCLIFSFYYLFVCFQFMVHSFGQTSSIFVTVALILFLFFLDPFLQFLFHGSFTHIAVDFFGRIYNSNMVTFDRSRRELHL